MTTVDVYCQDRSHPETRWEIGQFMLDVPDPEDPMVRHLAETTGEVARPMWMFGDPHSPVSRMRGIRRSRAWVTADGRYLTDDEVYGGRYDAEEHAVCPAEGNALEGAYLRWRLHCELCGLTFVRRDGDMRVILDTLAAAGISSVDLAPLGATLGRKLG